MESEIEGIVSNAMEEYAYVVSTVNPHKAGTEEHKMYNAVFNKNAIVERAVKKVLSLLTKEENKGND